RQELHCKSPENCATLWGIILKMKRFERPYLLTRYAPSSAVG
ncbi:5416_t:CDS:1, partial [Acaulospora colombiana]